MLIGIGGGLFNVPLNAYLQDRSPRESLGAILASGHQLTSIGILGVSLLFPLLRNGFHFGAPTVFLIAGIGTLPILLYTVWLIPQATIRFVVWLLQRLVYRVRIFGRNNIPETGPALLVANHVSWLDGILILLASSRPIRMIAYADYVKGGVIGWLSNLFGIIPIKAEDGPKGIIRSLKTASDALNNGELVCIFAEGRISRTGELLKFERGMMKILKGTDAPVLPVYLDELWGSIFSYERRKILLEKTEELALSGHDQFWKTAIAARKKLREVDVVRNAVLNLREDISKERSKERSMIPAIRFIRQCRLAWSRTKAADSSGASLTGGRLLTGALAFRSLLENEVLEADEKNVGILLPPSAGGVNCQPCSGARWTSVRKSQLHNV